MFSGTEDNREKSHLEKQLNKGLREYEETAPTAHIIPKFSRLGKGKHLVTCSLKVWLNLDFSFSATTDSIWSHKQTNWVQ
jgi:hypothetical protein